MVHLLSNYYLPWPVLNPYMHALSFKPHKNLRSQGSITTPLHRGRKTKQNKT